MRRFLRYDEAARELRLVMDDLWDGKHEHMEWTVLGSDDRPLRGTDARRWDGRSVDAAGAAHYVRVGTRSVPINTGSRPTVVFSSTPCRRVTVARARKCDLCTALMAP